MRIAYITAGAAGMYCGSCIHDNTVAAAMQRLGHEVSLIPTYTPIRTDETDVSIDRVFYGAVSVYLEQKSALFRHTPRLLDRILSSPRLLNWLTRKKSTTDARDLGALTLSVLRGAEGNQRKELESLVTWLRDTERPEIVHLTNSMLLGLAPRMKDELGVPVLCSVQGEDIFLDELSEPYRGRVRDALREQARHVDHFIATSGYYKDYMTGFLGVPAHKMSLVELGLNLEGHGTLAPRPEEPPFVVGYLARICPEKGLHELTESFRRLAARAGAERVRLRIAGYLGERDRAYLDRVLAQVREWGLEQAVEYVGEVDRQAKIDFLNSIHVLSVPTTYREPKGLFVLEALANGVPVVQPRHGAFPETIESLGGGLLVEPGSTDELTEALASLMRDPARREELGRQGREAVHSTRSDDQMARATLEVYRRHLLSSGTESPGRAVG